MYIYNIYIYYKIIYIYIIMYMYVYIYIYIYKCMFTKCLHANQVQVFEILLGGVCIHTV